MNKINIAGTELAVKDYHCIECDNFFKPTDGQTYLKKSETKLWMYVNVTNLCNAKCPFCVADVSGQEKKTLLDTRCFEKTLESVKEFVCGVSITGGEPMLYPDVVDRLIEIADNVLGPNVEIDLVTNGTNFITLAGLAQGRRLTSIHISRHHYDDLTNRKLMGWKSPSEDEIKRFLQLVDNPERVVFNCVLQKNGISSFEEVSKYLDFAIKLGVCNNSLITMIKANEYCEENFLSAFMFPIVSEDGCATWNATHPEARFDVWNSHRDHNFCGCLSGGYRNLAGRTRFYFRCPGTETSPNICRQLVYTSENELQDGFGEKRKKII